MCSWSVSRSIVRFFELCLVSRGHICISPNDNYSNFCRRIDQLFLITRPFFIISEVRNVLAIESALLFCSWKELEGSKFKQRRPEYPRATSNHENSLRNFEWKYFSLSKLRPFPPFIHRRYFIFIIVRPLLFQEWRDTLCWYYATTCARSLTWRPYTFRE